jgi:hypothetical protein
MTVEPEFKAFLYPIRGLKEARQNNLSNFTLLQQVESRSSNRHGTCCV